MEFLGNKCQKEENEIAFYDPSLESNKRNLLYLEVNAADVVKFTSRYGK